MKERLFRFLGNTKFALKRRWWWWIVLFIVEQIGEVLKHRIYGDINIAIDEHGGEYLKGAKPYILAVVEHPILIALVVFLAIVGAIVVHAYVDTLPSRVQGGENSVGGAGDSASSTPTGEILSDMVFKNQTLRLDGKKFIHCTFEQLTCIYNGTASVAMTECEFGPDINLTSESSTLNAYAGLQRMMVKNREHQVTIGFTFEKAEVEISPDSAPLAFKCKLRVYWTNDSDETIHLGVPLLKSVAIQDNHLTYSYQAGQWLQNPQKPWGDEVKELDVLPGRRCRIWLGLDPSLRDTALKLLDDGKLGLLIIPVTASQRTVNIYLRPRDRGLTEFNAQEYLVQKKAVTDNFVLLEHGSKEALRLLLLMRLMTAQALTDHLVKWKFPKAERIFDDLRNTPVPFVVSAGRSEFQINPTLEKIIKEVSVKDQSEFLKLWAEMPTDMMRYKIDNDPGFAERYNAVAASMQPLS
jgi:hypothetical protein